MSWVDQYVVPMTITTGDGVKYSDILTEAKYIKELEYNGTAYSFVEVNGQLVKKKKLLNREFPIDFCFCGEDCLDRSRQFDSSTFDQRPWTIEHPYYGIILVQVLGKIKFDDTQLNASRITFIATETISDQGVTVSNNPTDTIKSLNNRMGTVLEDDPILNTIASDKARDKDRILRTNAQNYQEAKKILKNPIDAENYFNTFNAANAAVNNFAAKPQLAIQSLINFINAPAIFIANVQDRVRILLKQFENLRGTINSLLNPSSRQLYQTQGAQLLSSLCLAASTPLAGNYSNPKVATQISQALASAFRKFTLDIDQLQGDNGADPLAFIPSFDIMNGLADVVNFTIANLYAIALNGRKQFSYTLPKDSNIYLLTYKFYKLDKFDNNLKQFIAQNNLNYSEIFLGLPKGKTVIYFSQA